MKAIKTVIILLISTTLLLACSTASKQEKKAKDFISAYYHQYAQKEELKAIFEDGFVLEVSETAISLPFDEALSEFLYANFDHMLTEKAIIDLLNKRILPTKEFIDASIIQATVKKVKFVEAKNEIEGTLSFTAIVVFERSDGAKTEETKTGLIRLVDKSDEWLVDYFRLN